MEIAETLLSHGADINDTNNGRGTALHLAAALDRPEMLKYLLHKGANPNVAVGLGYTPLHSAAYCNRVEIGRILLDHGADPGLRCDGRTALEITQCEQLRNLLREHGAGREP
jgi:ankyrin repeat protein